MVVSAVSSALGEGGKGIEAGKDIDGGESGDVRHKVKAVTVLRLHGMDGDSSDVHHKVKAVAALDESGDVSHKLTAVRAVTPDIR